MKIRINVCVSFDVLFTRITNMRAGFYPQRRTGG